MDTTFRGWSAILAWRVRLVISRLVLVFVLPLGFHGRLRVIRTMFIPGALHAVEASFLADSNIRKLRAAVCRVVWSSRQPMANAVAVLSLLDGPTGCDPAFCAYRPEEVPGVHRMIHSASESCPAHLLVESAAEAESGLVCLLSAPWLAPFSIFELQSGRLGGRKVSTALRARKGFPWSPLF